MLNYLYALLESESRPAASALGLNPGLGVLHVDIPARDSLACDLMKPVHPRVDDVVSDWITRAALEIGSGHRWHMQLTFAQLVASALNES